MMHNPSPSDLQSNAEPARILSRRIGRRRAWASPRIGMQTLQRLAEDPEALFQHPHAQVIKQSASTLLVRVPVQVEETEIVCGYKKVFRKTWVKRFADLFRKRDRSRHSFEMGHRFLQAGLPTPEPLWVIPPPRLSWNEPAYLGFEWMPAARDLNAWLANLSVQQMNEDAATRKQVYSVANQFATVLGRMHACGFCHRDLKFSNLLVDEESPEKRVYVIDLDGAAVGSGNDERWLWNLSRLAFDASSKKPLSNALMGRFLKEYLRANPRMTLKWKEVWQRLDQLVARRARRRDSVDLQQSPG